MTSGKKPRAAGSDDQLAIARRYHNEGRIAEASAAYRRILGRNPSDVEAMSLLGVAEGQSGRPKIAIELLATAAKLRPADTGILVNLAKALADGGRPDEARRVLEDAITHQPRSVDARTKLATLLLQAQRDLLS